MSTQSHYSLRWNNHQSHILAAFDALLQSETLVDVTLVCAETSVRAHKVVLSACSPFFQRVFSENPCKHPVIVLKDFQGWEVQAIVDFMYKGEISVIQEQLQSLIKAAESLQVRGLANQDPFGVDKEENSIVNQTPTPSTSPNDFDRSYFANGKFPGAQMQTPSDRQSPFSPIQNNFEPTVKLPHMPRLSFPEALMPRQDCQSPIPRRKQARPRRRSGELCGAQDLTTGSIKADSSPARSSSEAEAENLCVKKPKIDKVKDERASCTPSPHLRSPDLDHSNTNQSSNKDFRTSPALLQQQRNNGNGGNMSQQQQQVPMNLKQELEQQMHQNSNVHGNSSQPQPHSPMTFPPMPAVSALAMTPPHSKFFGLDSPLGLFPPGLENCRNPLFDMTDPRTTVDSSMFMKKKMGRPKGQHSAPRGGPPRSWTNAELTEALQHVWNKKMTTSQASRIFGIPYNSLLMYVRGKYGKSLKLEQLRKDCIEGPNTPGMDTLMGLGNNNNNLMKPVDRNQEPIQPNTRPSSRDQDQPPQPPLFNPFTHNFYPDFGTGFPIPVSMIHLLPQSEKARLDHGPYGQTPPDDTVDYSKTEKDISRELNALNRERDIQELRERVKEIKEESPAQDMFRPHNMSVDDRRELLQQNGQD